MGTERDTRQFRAGKNTYRRVIVKSAGAETLKPGAVMKYDPADDKWLLYTGAAAEDARAVLAINEDIVVAGAGERTLPICIGGKVFTDKLDIFSGAFAIDDRPNGAVLSIREQLRDVTIYAIDSAELTDFDTP